MCEWEVSMFHQCLAYLGQHHCMYSVSGQFTVACVCYCPIAAWPSLGQVNLPQRGNWLSFQSDQLVIIFICLHFSLLSVHKTLINWKNYVYTCTRTSAFYDRFLKYGFQTATHVPQNFVVYNWLNNCSELPISVSVSNAVVMLYTPICVRNKWRRSNGWYSDTATCLPAFISSAWR